MYKLIALFLVALTVQVQAICLTDCRSTKCASLDYYMKKCNACNPRFVGKQCVISFCQNHPELCQNGSPLPKLSTSMPDIRPDVNQVDRQHAVCYAPLFKNWAFEGNSSRTLTPENLNTLTIVFFEQTKAATPEAVHLRNIGSVRNLLANYFAELYPELWTMDPQKASSQVSLMTRMKVGKSLDKCSNLDFHNIVEQVRKEVFAKKGIPTDKVFEKFNNRNYPITIANMGCSSEKLFKPIR